MRPLTELVKSNLAAERIAVNPEKASGPRLVAAGPVQDALDEFFLEFIHRFVKMNSALHHLPDQRFQLILHRRTLHNELDRRREIPPARPI